MQRPGAFRLERNMTVIQGLVTGGGLTVRGNDGGLRLHRRDDAGQLRTYDAQFDTPLQANDVLYVRERLF